MKVVILAGGLGTRISEESHLKPKPMIAIGEMPIMIHIMKYYSSFGYNDFIICCGYKSHVIKEYFSNLYLYNSTDVTFDFSKSSASNVEIHQCVVEPWKVTLVDTGELNMTGSRIKQIKKHIPAGEDFMLTYGDGVSDVDINALITQHRNTGKLATMTAVQPPAKWGVLDIDTDMRINDFKEKPATDGGWINGGYMVLNYGVFDYINDDPMCVFEREPLENLAKDGQLEAYKHRGFWQAMDTMRDKNQLEAMWEKGDAPWKKW